MTDETRSKPLSPEAIAEALRGLDGGMPEQPCALAVPGCRLVRELHRGGQGVVYLAVQVSTRRPVAVKVLLERGGADGLARKRFHQEIRLIAKLQHPHIVTLHDSGETSDGRLYYVMEYVHGAPLRAYVREQKLDLEAVLKLFALLCETVEELHTRGIVHRDLKPSNVLVDPNGRLVVLDLGLAMTLSADVETILSQPGDLLGTLAYMSPEQAGMTGAELDPRSDVYSLGVMLYEILTGELPCSTKGAVEVVLQRIRETPPNSLRKAWTFERGLKSTPLGGNQGTSCPLGAELETIVRTCLAKERSRRYASAGEIAGDLQRHLSGERIAARGEAPWLAPAYRMQRRMQRHPWAAFIGAMTISGLLTAFAGGAVLLRWTTLDRQWETWLGDAFVEPLNAEKLSRVHIIGITDDTDINALAQQENLPDVSRENVPSWRRLHGRLMAHLADSGCRAVIWDIRFRTKSVFDQDFVEGVRALKNKGIPTVVAVEAYWSGDRGLEMLAPTLATEVNWGAVAAGFTADHPWWIPFAVRRGTRDILPSLTLQALASARWPGHPIWFQFDDSEPLVRLGRQTTVIGESAAGWMTVDRIRLADWMPISESDQPPAQFGLGVGDVTGVMDVPMPTDHVLFTSTIEYSKIFEQTERELQDIFKKKVIVIGPLQSDAPDQFKHPDGRTLHGVYGQAVAMDAALRAVIARLPSRREFGLTGALGAILGSCVVLLAVRHVWLGLIGSVLLLSATILIAAIFLRITAQFVFNPLVPGFAVLMAASLGAVVCRVSGWRWHLKR